MQTAYNLEHMQESYPNRMEARMNIKKGMTRISIWCKQWHAHMYSKM